MAETPSNMIPLGFIAPDFRLTDTISGKEFTRDQLASDKATVVMFISNHCPFVKHINAKLVQLANDYIPKRISFIAIGSNDVVNYPEDSPEKMNEYGKYLKYPFPYLYDETQEVARLYDAACTPDFYIFDKDLKCVYRGQLDNARPGNNKPVTGVDMRNAIDAILNGKEINPIQTPSIGCNIKWK